MSEAPGSARLMLVPGVAHLDEPVAVFEAMVAGWERQQSSRMLGQATIRARTLLLRRFAEFAETMPWDWTATDVEDFTVSLVSGSSRKAPSTVRGYHLTLRMFCDYLADRSYGWGEECDRRFGAVPSQICHEWNTVAHLAQYEGRPGRRPLTYDEVQRLFDVLDDRVERCAASGRKGAFSALRDSLMIKCAYAFGLRRNELCRLDLADLRPNPHQQPWGRYGSVHVRYGKASRGGVPRRRTVLTVPEFDWAVEALTLWVEHGRPLIDPTGQHPALWLTERGTRVTVGHADRRFADLRALSGLDPALSLHCLRHSYVTHLIEFGYPERFVQEQVGQAYASTTAIYASVSNDFMNRALKTALCRVYPDGTKEQP